MSSSFPGARLSFTARLRSEDSRLTRRIALSRGSRPRWTVLSPEAATTFSKAGNWASTTLEVRMRPPTVNTRWLSTGCKVRLSSVSRSRAISLMALRGTSTRSGSATFKATFRGAKARRWPSVATMGAVQVGGRDPHLAPPGLHQDVGENRDGVLPLHDPLHELQFLHEVVAADDDFHAYPRVSFNAEGTSYEGKRWARNVGSLP